MLNIITIDGPTASGKGTISKKLANKLNWKILDSGSIYRAISYMALKKNLSIFNIQEILLLIKDSKLIFKDSKIFLENVDISQKIRTEEIGSFASKISKFNNIRKVLIDYQRSFYTNTGLVADGRDMGTVVFPEAKLKIFLTANIEIRIKRRFNQLTKKGVSANLKNLAKSIKDRDLADINRSCSPLIIAKDAYVIDSSYIDSDKVTNYIFNIWMNRFCCIK
ncbi:Cytidylate kinase [Candidatus Kinetoplastibacterium sorsogonicusi]|uniref:Cytidylate kinase n=1 Tax=Candidatus Kinetoplastidibacterium kentomonadis TaxID=1576550 RepID=A0A3S7JA43_9PROT|nr:(d)CMP kinase [Candidatus Kinetoplastibacterium sorsogonicusi]AWD32526.1 Cytidylate kinase [Candidatus Kinetoplastibacterium sorsogonicusi]